METTDKKRLLDPDVLSSLPNLILKVKSVLSSLSTGLHRSSYHGSSVEFSEHKQYSAGDEPKWIDWKLFARTDKYYIKQFENEANLKSYLLIDHSASMGYRGVDGKGISKLDYACILSASVAYLLIKQQDAVGLVLSSAGKTDFLPTGWKSGYLNLIINKLDALVPEKGSGIESAIRMLSENIPKRGIAFVISDLLENDAAVLDSLKLLRQRGQKVFLLHIMHNSELTFPFSDTMNMFDVEIENPEKITIDSSRAKNSYIKELNKFINWWKRESLANDIDYLLIDTSTPVHIPLGNILVK